jgi:hypothetical protein
MTLVGLEKSSMQILLATKALTAARKRGNWKVKGTEPANNDEE